jgi:hypothetical protein
MQTTYQELVKLGFKLPCLAKRSLKFLGDFARDFDYIYSYNYIQYS